MSQTTPALLADRIRTALSQTSRGADIPEGFSVEVTPATDPKFGDYQANTAMVLAKRLKTNPRALAAELVKALEVSDLCEEPEIAGPGFLNFRLLPGVIADRALGLLTDARLGVAPVEKPQTIVIDFSAPNVAKPMHVGHIRSTIIGESLSRIARFLGHKVITDNHIGDWGTQFGMILHGWKSILDQKALETDPIAELLRVYKEVNARAKADESVLTQCRQELVALQAGDEENLAIWKRCVDLSLQALHRIYEQLDVSFDHWLGESHYNDALAPLVEEMLAQGIARESDGAICVFSDDSLPPQDDPFKIQRDGEWENNPAIVRKSDGGFLYATTDLATIDHRVREWQAEQIWYVVGVEQSLHMRQLFEASRRRGHDGVGLVHVAFGGILGPDRKRFKTRSGESVGLVEVLDGAIERALAFLEKREEEDDRFHLEPAEKEGVARIIGLGSVKYAELSQARMTDYVFDWDRMLSLSGNTAPYLINSYVRTRGIFRKLEAAWEPPEAIALTEPGERALAMKLLRFGEVVPDVLNDHKPNLLAAYLYELAKAYHSFYEACPVLKAEGNVRETRLALCEATSRVLRHGLELLGIEVTERM